MEFAPLLGKVQGAPAAGDLREVGGVEVGDACGCEGGAGVEEVSTFRAKLEILLLVEADAEQV